MKNKILQIMYKLSKGEIKYNLASKQVLDLFGVSGMFSSDKLEQAYKMKNKILQIMYKLSKGEIKYNLASKQVLDLFGVSGMFSSDKL